MYYLTAQFKIINYNIWCNYPRLFTLIYSMTVTRKLPASNSSRLHTECKNLHLVSRKMYIWSDCYIKMFKLKFFISVMINNLLFIAYNVSFAKLAQRLVWSSSFKELQQSDKLYMICCSRQARTESSNGNPFTIDFINTKQPTQTNK